MAIIRQDERLDKAVDTDADVIPRYNLLAPNGTIFAENLELQLQNRILQEGMPYNAAFANENLSASGITTGTATALLLAQSQYYLFDGAVVRFRNHVALGPGAFTLNINSTGAKPVAKADGTAISSIAIGAWVTVIYSAIAEKYLLEVTGSSGDMLQVDYDENSHVFNSGGIPAYVRNMAIVGNHIINGGFEINQRTDLDSAAVAVTFSILCRIDRWLMWAISDSTVQRVQNTLGGKSKYALEFIIPYGSAYLEQRLETPMDKSNGVTVQFRAKLAGAAFVHFFDGAGAKETINLAVKTGAAEYVATLDPSTTLTDVKKIQIELRYPQSPPPPQITGITCAEGMTGMPYVPPDPTLELLRCRRFYRPWGAREMFSGFATASIGYFWVPTPVEMRTTPTLKYSALSDFSVRSNGTGVTPTAMAVEAITPTGFRLLATAAGTPNQVGVVLNNNLTLSCGFDAEIY